MTAFRRSFPIVIVCLLSAFAADSAVIYMSPGGGGTGASWSSPLGSITAALSAAAPGDEIWVKQGTYYPSVTGNIDSSFTLKPGVSLYGGFGGTETARALRADTTGTLTILSGALGTALNSKHVIQCPSGAAASTVLDGFTISDGALSTGTAVGGGAGMYCSGSPTLSHLTFKKNSVTVQLSLANNYIAGGAGLYTSGGSPYISSCLFSDNNVLVSNSNTTYAGYIGGAGMLSNGGSPVMDQVVFERNHVTRTSGNIFPAGGGFFAYNTTGAQITNSVFRGNTCVSSNSSTPGAGAGIACIGLTSNITGQHLTVTNVLFDNDTADRGACAFLQTGRMTIVNASCYNRLDYFQSPSYVALEAHYSVLTIANSIIDGSIVTDNNNVVCNNSFLGSGFPNAPVYSGSNNVLAYNFSTHFPQYVDPVHGNFSLQPCSPTINGGDSTKNMLAADLAGSARKFGQIDMGVYEYGRAATLPDPVYVNAASTVLLPDGASWATAFRGLNLATDCHCNGAHAAQVWVAAGTYTPQNTELFGPVGRDARFDMYSGQAWYGGFAGYETALSQRDSTGGNNITTLSGEIQGDGTDTNNAYSVVVGTGVDSNALLSGFTITGGNSRFGGAIYGMGARFRLRNLSIKRNRSSGDGGGIGVFNSSAKLYNIEISDCRAGNGGGGFYAENAQIFPYPFGRQELHNVRFMRDSGSEGGGLYLQQCDATLEDVQFLDNRAIHYGGGLTAYSSGAMVNHASFIGNVVTDTSNAGFSGGGIKMATATNNTFVMNDVLFARNRANYGAALDFTSGVASSGATASLFSNVTFSGNRAKYQGNALLSNNGILKFRNCIFDSVANGYAQLIEKQMGSPRISVFNTLFGGSKPALAADSGANIYNKDPIFTYPAADDYTLRACSPAIDAGDSSLRTPGIATDLGGMPRRYGGGVIDLGAYEYQGQPQLPPVISGQPRDTTLHPGDTLTLRAIATGSGITYQWQQSNSSGTWANIPGATGDSLLITGITSGMNGYRYRCIISGCITLQTTAATLTVITPPPPAGIQQTGVPGYTISHYPNPVSRDGYIYLTAYEAGVVMLSMADMTGRTLLEDVFAVQSGRNTLHYCAGALHAGVYVVSLTIRRANGVIGRIAVFKVSKE